MAHLQRRPRKIATRRSVRSAVAVKEVAAVEIVTAKTVATERTAKMKTESEKGLAMEKVAAVAPGALEDPPAHMTAAAETLARRIVAVTAGEDPRDAPPQKEMIATVEVPAKTKIAAMIAAEAAKENPTVTIAAGKRMRSVDGQDKHGAEKTVAVQTLAAQTDDDD